MYERIFVCGHSFSRRLENFCRTPHFQNMGLRRGKVYFIGYNNNHRISYAHQLEQWLDSHTNALNQATVLSMDIACNDMIHRAGSYFMDPLNLAHYVYYLACKARLAGVRRVIILQMLFRAGRAAVPRGSRRHMCRAEIQYHQDIYNEAVLAYNRCLRDLCMNGDPAITFRAQRGMHQKWSRRLSSDGVHPTWEGLMAYYNNLRSALITQAFKARPH